MNEIHAGGCPVPCTTMEISYGIPIVSSLDIGTNEAYMKLYFKNRISERQSMEAYTITSLVADIGGYLGLLLGFSVLDIAIAFQHNCSQ